MQSGSEKLLLASASPRRRDILSEMGYVFEIVPSDVDESKVRAISPKRLVCKLSKAKAEAVSGGIVIGADTVVARFGRVFTKPLDENHAAEMLGALCGKWHTVYTGVTVMGGGRKVCFCEKSRVKLKKLSKEDICAYVKSGKPLDKAGAYGIQDGFVVEKYVGSYTNIVGLPKEKLADVLAEFGVANGFS